MFSAAYSVSRWPTCHLRARSTERELSGSAQERVALAQLQAGGGQQGWMGWRACSRGLARSGVAVHGSSGWPWPSLARRPPAARPSQRAPNHPTDRADDQELQQVLAAQRLKAAHAHRADEERQELVGGRWMASGGVGRVVRRGPVGATAVAGSKAAAAAAAQSRAGRTQPPTHRPPTCVQ